MRLGSWLTLVCATLAWGWACSGEPFEAVATGGAKSGGTSGTAGSDGGGTGGLGGTGGTGGTGGGACSSAQKLCGGVCVDVSSNPSHCGDCDQPCSPGECKAGACVSVTCAPNAVEPCYTGPSGTENVGICGAGTRSCDALGASWGSCEGEVVPQSTDDCLNAEDDDCDGTVNQGCIPVSCAAIKAANASAQTGTFQIDPDGEGGDAPFDVHCEMNLVNGGWTRFNWVKNAYVAGQDPLGQKLSTCKPTDAICRGRIPTAAQPKQLLVRDITDDGHAVWEFDGVNPVAVAALKALRDKTTICLKDKAPWQPSIDVSTEDFCGKGAEGGCDSFYYSGGGCSGATGWGLMLDGDGQACKAAFKMGATIGISCGQTDRGYLNSCACSDETGELYYR